MGRGALLSPHGHHREVWFSFCGNSQLTAVLKDTVLPSVSPSRRWKSPSTPDTSAPSAERPPSSVTLSVSGTASLASALLRKSKFLTLQDIGSWHCRGHTLRRCALPENGADMDNSGGAYTVATPAAAAMRSTLRRLREIAEV